MTELDTMYRIMILYMLNKLEYPLTNTQITNFILERITQIISLCSRQFPICSPQN